MPVVPAAIRGARHILPADLMFPRRGPIEVEILDPIAAEGHPREIAVHLRKAAREALLERVGEPDLEA
jgi:1-acyl-sn-glycerol-3-phosphate acyltransferase